MEDLAYWPSEGGIFAKLTKLSSSFDNLLEAVFCGFSKNSRMLSNFNKLLELLSIGESLLFSPNIFLGIRKYGFLVGMKMVRIFFDRI